MKLSYELNHGGWATATIEDEGHGLIMRVSYLCDTLLHMTEAAIGLKKGTKWNRFFLAEEPGYHECIVTRAGAGKAHVRVLYGPDWWCGPGRDRKAREVFACTCSIEQFCLEVAGCLQRLLDDHGLKRYKDAWGMHEFPLAKFEQLHRLLFGRGVTHTKRPRSRKFAKSSWTRHKEHVRDDGWRSGVRARIAAGLERSGDIPKRSAKVPRRYKRPAERRLWAQNWRFGYAIGSE